MFAMLGGAAWAGAEPGDAASVQVAAGLEVVTDGRETLPDGEAAARVADDLASGRGIGAVERWVAAVATSPAAAAAVAAALPGPCSLARRAAGGGPGAGGAGRARSTVDAALVRALGGALAREAADLGAAGCPLVRLDEPDALAPAAPAPDAPAPAVAEAERAAFLAAHRAVAAAGADAAAGPHLMLALTGGDHAWLGADVLADTGYASYLFDLIAGPTDWRLVAALPGERGVVCGVVDAASSAGDEPEILVWAAHYAASMRRRGLARVGLATTGSLAVLSRETAVTKLGALGEGARIAALPADEIRTRLDPRAIDLRSAALGAWAPDPRLPRPPRV
jgi:methionine synthase II (cobalamin-independent)